MSGLVSFLSGSVFRMVWGEIASFVTKHQEYKQELELTKLQASIANDTHTRNLEALKLVGGKPFNIQNNFLVDPKTYEIKKSFKNGGNITRESEWELVNETNKKLPKRRLNLNKSSDWEIVD